ncbi:MULTISPECIES: bifunctional 2-polyprenyl-6-hydroxyphenol methylase/3-demethylubiquinol 3-O-methyltransferase UbiG [unclassified Brevundimonas]|uniref:bifunctional 2-polyprenyl-6-hydroxyphenol methylase/3-demethylubiquinol 3-O-methyltransferase UbiG n=1 Tax=unclassified Brevundimonas TaxID=2622653 RepID=UPI000E847969|nr:MULTISPECIES: bifunctional 2-polyprenyl-6-hydroxyphenol methylase/3-demethylubiquinol 3-O-methyltransferase UbiG [unclassified Brevundimonas]MCK6105395.1 bifunctional 2-polyprenyl-6-hydroxyphenol methylase/3-demethylubiquinol 3-O-methyltransferase UbiG [Brevundimonas sp. EYE_349]HBI19147.1 bifunctional 3-demethylubiquinol 3-O-methyltransferase/2-polyprenyl-6-hydroxyphenol methylase [Brevundimonas sp.]
MTASNGAASPRLPRSGQGFSQNSSEGAFGASIDPADVARFSAQAAEWWDARGPFAPLHRFNPARLKLIREQLCVRLGRDAGAIRPFEGLTLLDVGCGGGLIAEPMRRMGFEVSAIDASSENIGTARAHADMVGLDIAYRAATVEQIEAEGAGPFDVVLTMEVIEHVADPESFVRACSRLVRRRGVMMVATLNRTLKSLALGKVAAEYILRWVPAGTHDWRQFLKPDEIRAMLAAEPVTVEGPYGLNYDPLNDRWSQSDDAGINYMMVVTTGA